MKGFRRNSEDSSIAFLDIICCGFGAIILLLVIVKTGTPDVLESSDQQQGGRIKALQEELFQLRGEIDYLERELTSKQEQLDVETERVAIMRGELDQRGQILAARQTAQIDEEERREDLRIALQSLSEEMRRLLGDAYQRRDNVIGGIPVDSEYVIFIIDTSGSMYNYAWGLVVNEISHILDIYPNLNGMQVMNDMGDYMFGTYRGQWIPDTPSRRQVMLQQLRNWHPFSNSSPVEGITAAIRSFYSPDRKISLYVFGDDYTGRLLGPVLDTVKSLNRENPDGEPMVRIHAVGFPVQFLGNAGQNSSGARFAALMRELANQNNGTFVGLNDFR
ncbi:MAG: hypothetical protein RLN82_05935 [Pseudomonadales bacterium]